MLIQCQKPSSTTISRRYDEIPSLEKRSIGLQQEVKIYLSASAAQGSTEANGRRSIVIIEYAINLEHIGDIIEKGLTDTGRQEDLHWA